LNELLNGTRDYSSFSLKDNPFPYSPVPRDQIDVFVDQTQTKDALENVLGTALSTGKSNHLVITGKYGNGKSHSLKYGKNLVNEHSESVVGYVPQPGSSFLDIYHEFMYDLGYDFFRDLVHSYLTIIVEEYELGPHEEIQTGQDLEEAVDQGKVLLSEVVPKALRELKDLSQFTDLSRALVHLIYEETSMLAWQWLSGEGLRYEQRKKMDIHSDIDDEHKAVKAFTTIKKLIQELDRGPLFLFVDEFESISRITNKRKQRLLNSVRHVMDMNPLGFSLIIACAPEVWQEVMAEYHAFAERIGREVALRPLNFENAKRLIEEYLKSAKKADQTPENPFTDEAIEQILQQSRGNVRQLISYCGRLLDHAVDNERTVIDDKVISDFN
jgi:type II secretory pathway predicted ATPase ExeA